MSVPLSLSSGTDRKGALRLRFGLREKAHHAPAERLPFSQPEPLRGVAIYKAPRKGKAGEFFQHLRGVLPRGGRLRPGLKSLMTFASTVLVKTDHASRYLQQLCKHWAHHLSVTFTPEKGQVTF